MLKPEKNSDASERPLDLIVRRTELLAEFVKTQMDKPWLDWPTVRELAKRYHCKQDEIIGIVDDHENLDLIVGMRTGSGHSEFDTKGDYRVEWYA